ncbi:MAG: hypothetical protein A3F78_14365 [Burkholderiales bacterium RIFCSPLOWO2_12_FULL_61_40]|nr:MAG: hypothetical protein A3F78_14365 [Burkholderiales bacterium RIFCSPLOWO2_12_FULL_61_40]
MPLVNTDIAAVFSEIADLLEMEDANPFRVRAYRNAVRTLGEMGHSVKEMVARHENLDALPGIGPKLAAMITEVVDTGTCAQLERLRQEVAPALAELLRLPGLGPKRVRALHQELGIETLDQLRRAAEQGRIQTVHGFVIKRIAQGDVGIFIPNPVYHEFVARHREVDAHAVGATLVLVLLLKFDHDMAGHQIGGEGLQFVRVFTRPGLKCI